MKALINASIERGSIKNHVQCRKNYTRKSSINAVKRRRQQEAGSSKINPPRSRTRRGETTFCFNQCCLFCGNELNEYLEKKKH